LPLRNDTVSFMGRSGARIRQNGLDRVREEFESMKVRGFPIHSMFPNDSKALKVGGVVSDDPCKADIVATGFGWPYGFGSRAGLAANEIQLAAVFGLSIAICGDDFAQGTWADHFKNPAGLSICTPAEACGGGQREISEAAALGNDLSNELKGVDREYLLKLKETVYRSMFTYNDASQAAVNEMLASLRLGTSDPYVGVHIRRGDKEREHDVSLMPISSYMAAAREHMEARDIRTVFVASDDPDAGHMLAEEFVAVGRSDVQVLQLTDASSDYAVDDSGKREYTDQGTTIALLADIEALRLATVFVGTQSSNVGRMVFYLRGDIDSCISIDGDWFEHDWL